jgi:Lar family restriction alleviation protein
MTEPTELMPCPFCGGNARKVKHSAGSPGTIGYDRWHGVACAGCNACVGARDRRFRTSAAAIAAWNTRTPQPTQAQSVAVPLTDEQIEALPMWKRFVGLWPETRREIVRTIERHHGIKGGQHGTE